MNYNFKIRKCCIPGCDSTNLGIHGLHHIPKDNDERNKWFQSLKIWSDRKSLYFCDLHFQASDVFVSEFSGEKP